MSIGPGPYITGGLMVSSGSQFYTLDDGGASCCGQNGGSGSGSGSGSGNGGAALLLDAGGSSCCGQNGGNAGGAGNGGGTGDGGATLDTLDSGGSSCCNQNGGSGNGSGSGDGSGNGGAMLDIASDGGSGSSSCCPCGPNSGATFTGWSSPFFSQPSYCCQAPPNEPGGCVAPTTCIALYPTGYKQAWELLVGDLLLTRTDSGELCGEEIIGLEVTQQPCIFLETEDGTGLDCSLSHEMMVDAGLCLPGKRVRVSELALTDKLLAQEGTPLPLCRMVRTHDAPVVRISLAGPNHLYLSNGLWSHNKSRVIPPPP